ncbi:TolC family outer membrane protein [Hephaestia sp. MAHUQ-44]|uniref:TolC family outer membrane protein n=1 Tax=Hephaestia sp. MAHUQ-44 TaxID=2952526 RepID=UPI0020772A7B|nr:TolC family outer membrane protein [Hephaestia sp. MAHUQ-44]MCM8730239.1 TolC family outer membrane protein [Hephaestia sp. MAHUQ-44]
MTLRPVLLAGVALALIASPASAETLREALLKAYQTNPTLNAERASQRANDENVPIARSRGMPQLNVNGGYSESVLSATNNFVSPPRSVNAQAQASLPIFSGGAVRNAVAAAKTRVEAGRAGLRGTEADLFSAVVAAYMDVIRDEAIVSLNQQNVRVLDVNLQATQDRFQVGDLTRTDVAQSEARLALARSDLQSAEANLIGSRENYIRLVGTPPGDLEPPPALTGLPGAPEAAVDVALENNPTLIAARKASRAADYDIGTARAGRLPTISVGATTNYYNYLGSLRAGDSAGTVQQSGTSADAGVSISIPLFQGGRPAAEVRQAQARRSQAIEQALDAERSVVSQTRSAYAIWQSAQQVIQSSEKAVSANRLSLEGVRAENSVGNRTILDILNAEQELLNAQVTLVTARRDAYVAGFALIAAMGKAEARDLGLDGGVLYDPVTNYERVHDRIWDWDSDPAPRAVGTSTAETPAQGAEVHQALDPILDTPVDRSLANPAGDTLSDRP